MKKYFPIFALLFCTACFASKKTTKARFEYGMTHEAVLAMIKSRSELLVAEFTYPQGHLAAYQYGLVGRMPAAQDRYILYYMNDTLIRKSPPENLEDGAKLAVEQYYKGKQQKEEREAKYQQEQEDRKNNTGVKKKRGWFR